LNFSTCSTKFNRHCYGLYAAVATYNNVCQIPDCVLVPHTLTCKKPRIFVAVEQSEGASKLVVLLLTCEYYWHPSLKCETSQPRYFTCC